MNIWRTSKRELPLRPRPLVMGILNVTPDSFSDGGRFASRDSALERVASMVEEGADIIDIGGESTRPGAGRVDAAEEIERVVPVIAEIVSRFDISVSIDTTKAAVAEAALAAGADIVNDISGLRFEPEIARVASRHEAGLVVMHSRGSFDDMHSQTPVDEIVPEVLSGLRECVTSAFEAGISNDRLCIDVGIGFGKTARQNLELIAKLGDIRAGLPRLPILIGASRKSFIGKLLGGAPVDRRVCGSLAVHAVAAWNGADVIRAHDVRPTRDLAEAIGALRSSIS